jgi:hypothetical protein
LFKYFLTFLLCKYTKKAWYYQAFNVTKLLSYQQL